MSRLGFYEFYEFSCKNGFKWVIIGSLGRSVRPKMGSAEV